jgi:hypothetical protein
LAWSLAAVSSFAVIVLVFVVVVVVVVVVAVVVVVVVVVVVAVVVKSQVGDVWCEAPSSFCLHMCFCC